MFDIVAGKVVIDAKTLSIPPFANYYNKVKDKAHAEKIIQYVVFKHRWNTPYKAYSPEDRDIIIQKDVFGGPIVFSIDEQEFERRYVELQATPLTRLLEAAEEGVEYLIRQFNSLRDKEDKTDNYGKPLITANDVGRWLDRISGTVKSLDTLKKQVASEQVEGSRVKGGSEIGHYELPKR